MRRAIAVKPCIPYSGVRGLSCGVVQYAGRRSPRCSGAGFKSTIDDQVWGGSGGSDRQADRRGYGSAFLSSGDSDGAGSHGGCAAGRKGMTLVEAVGLVPKVAVTPRRQSEWRAFSFRVNRQKASQKLVLLPAAPCLTVRLEGEADSEKFGSRHRIYGERNVTALRQSSGRSSNRDG